MIEEIQRLIDEYTRWLKEGTSLKQVDEWVEVTTPYLDRHNDHLQLYVRSEDSGYLLTDDGYVIEDLRRSGCDVDTPKRKELLQLTLNGFGIELKDHELTTRARQETFSQRKHNLVQAMLAVNDLFYLAEPHVASVFLEDVQAWMDLAGIRYTPRIKLPGRSGYDHMFDFIVPRSRERPERLIKTINRPSRDSAEAAAFAWIDVREMREANTSAYALLNDTEREPGTPVIEALTTYGIHPVPWSRRDTVREELAA
jgi:hypothetical protein